MLMAFGEVLDHIRQHVPDVAVGNAVEHLFAPSPRLQEPSGPQKTQVMGDQRLAEPEPGGDLSHAQRSIQDDARRSRAICGVALVVGAVMSSALFCGE